MTSPLGGSVGGSSGGGNTVIYQQGGTAGAGVYTTWADALAAAQAKDGPVTIYIDPTVDPPTIPSGTHDLDLRIRLVAYLTDTPGSPCVLSISSGAVLQDAVFFENIAFEGNLTTPLLTASGGNVLSVTFVRCRHTDLGNGDAFCTLPTGTSVFFLQGSAFAMDAEPFAALASGKNVTVYLDPASSFDQESFTGAAGTLTVNAAVGAVFETQLGFSGTLALTNQSAHSAKITDLATPTASTDAVTKAYVDGLDALVGAGVFGDGSDGNATITGGTTTLTRDTYYNNLTITSTGRLSTAGFRVFVKGTLTVDSGGTLDARGGTTAAPFNTTAGKGDSTQASSALNRPQGGNSTGNGSVYGAAGKGGNGGSDLGSTGGTGTASSNAVGGKGGAGGAGVGTGFGAGGTAGALTAPTYQPSFAFPECLLATFQSLGTPPGTPTALRGGSGGGGGGYGGSYSGGQNATFGGGGGCGGGVLVVIARIVINNGTINADGADGGAGGGNAVDNKYGGGGGGGGGGYAICVYRSWTGNAPTANGGAGGAAGGGAAVAGSAGAAGKVLALQI